MEVGDHVVVDPVDACIRSGGEDPVSVAVTREAAVDEEGLARRRDNERSLPALNIDEVDTERLLRRRGRGREEDQETDADRRTARSRP